MDAVSYEVGDSRVNGTMNATGINVVAAERFVYFCEAVIQPVILSFGLLTNVASLCVLQKVKLASTFRTCLIALAISDLCASCTGFTQILVEVICFGGSIPFGHWHPGAVASVSLYFTFLMFMCTSNSIVILVTVIRNLIVLKPIKARLYFSRKRTKWICLGIAVCTFFIYAPVSLNVLWQSCYNDDVTEICVRVNETITLARLESIVNRYLFTISLLYGPVLLFVYITCIVGIWLTLKRSTIELSRMTSQCDGNDSLTVINQAKHRNNARGRITRTLLKILILDIVCIVPTVAYGFALVIRPKETVFDDSQIIYEVFDVIAEVFLCCRPAYNFWVYLYQHEEFRDGFKSLFSGVSQASVRMRRRCRGLLPSLHRKSYDVRSSGPNSENSAGMMHLRSSADEAKHGVIFLPRRKISRIQEDRNELESADSDSFMVENYH